jgi:beta-lactamase regulating signal transducer with metallopeptidase domain
LLECREGPPFAAGLLRPVVVVPKFGTWSEADREAALIHETAHLKRRILKGWRSPN